MAVPEVFEAFSQKCAFPVMVRAVVERAFCDEVLDGVFKCCSRQQHSRKLLFSTCVSLMASVVTRVQPTLGAAIRTQEDFLPVNRDSVYDKITGLEDDVVTGALAVTAADLAEVVDEVGGIRPALVPGLRTLVLDGNHLKAVHHRIKALRGLPQAALPGTCIALLDADRKLFIDAFLLQDGHAGEGQVLPDVTARLRPRDLLLADRNFCLREFAAAVEDRQAFFLLRQHANRFPLKLLGERVYVGDSETGRIYEQQASYELNGEWRAVRRITVERYQLTRDGAAVLHLLTNLPTTVVDPASGQTVVIDGLKIAAAYPTRWSVETAFHTLTVDLNCELNSLGYPPAALFGFCVAAMCYNAYSTAIAALRGHFGVERVEREFSTYYLANDVRAVWEGMNVAITEETWSETFGHLSLRELADHLLMLASQIEPSRYRKAPTRPHRPPVKGASKRAKSRHTSVFKELHRSSAD